MTTFLLWNSGNTYVYKVKCDPSPLGGILTPSLPSQGVTTAGSMLPYLKSFFCYIYIYIYFPKYSFYAKLYSTYLSLISVKSVMNYSELTCSPFLVESNVLEISRLFPLHPYTLSRVDLAMLPG